MTKYGENYKLLKESRVVEERARFADIDDHLEMAILEMRGLFSRKEIKQMLEQRVHRMLEQIFY